MLSNHEMKQRLSYLLLGQRGGMNRVQILGMLKERPYNVNQIASRLDLNYRTIKHHVDILVEHGLIGTSNTGGYGEVYFLSPDLETRMPLLKEISDKVQTITASPKFHQSVMEQTNDAVVIVDDGMDVIFWNRSAQELFGYTLEEVMGGKLPVFPDLDALRRVLRTVAEGKKAVGLEMAARHRSGRSLDIEMTIDEIKGEDGRSIGYSMIAMDITERKQALQALLASQQRYALAQQAARIISWEWDVKTDGMVWSDRPGPFLGLGQSFRGATFKDFLGCVHPDDRALVRKAADSILKRGRDVSIEHRIERPDGTVRWVRHTGGVIRDKKGKALNLVGIIQDVTERRDSESRYSRILETSLDGFWINDLKGRLVEVNESYCRMLGYTRQQLLRKSISDIEATEKPAETLRHIKRIIKEGSGRFETRHRRKDGSLIDLDVSATFLDSDGGRLVVFLRDITERKRAEEALRLSEQRYALAQRAASIGSWDWDITTGGLEWSETIEPMFGFPPGRFKGTYGAFLESVHPDDRTLVEGSVQAALERNKPYDIEHRIVWPDGSIHWMSEKGEVFRDAEGTPVRMLGVVQDVTARKDAEDRIRHLASFPELNPDPVIEMDLEGNITYSNPMTERVMREVGLLDPSELEPPGLETVMVELARHPGRVVERDFPVKDRVFRTSVFQPGGLQRYRLYISDITDQVRKERELEGMRAQLARKDRMEALGQLASAAGQELSVPLTAIKNAVYYLRMVLREDDHEARQALDILRREVGASEIALRELQDISKARPPDMRLVELDGLLGRTLSRARIPGGVEVVRRTEERLPTILADPEQLEVVVHNLVQNAVEAMPGGGKLEVIAARAGDSSVEVSVRDTGRGIPKEDLGKVFGAFFTTKPRGIGLGLPVARTLVENHGGSIRVESEVGRGSTFTVTLPVGTDGGRRP